MFLNKDSLEHIISCNALLLNLLTPNSPAFISLILFVPGVPGRFTTINITIFISIQIFPQENLI